MMENPSSVKQQIGKGYKIATGVEISDKKSKVFEALFSNTMQQLNKDKNRVNKMLSDSSVQKQGNELAALAVVTNAILNLDEVITKN